MTPYPPIHAPDVPYPPPFYMTKPNCSRGAEVSLDGTTMSPGSWRDPFPPEGVSNLDSGTYCLSGDFIMGAGSLSGSHVLFDREGGQFHIGGGVTLNLTAQDSGPNPGLLVYQPMQNRQPVILNLAVDSSFAGSVLAPGAEIRIKGSDSAAGFHSQLIL